MSNKINDKSVIGHGHRHRLRTGVELARRVQGLHHGTPEWAVVSTDLDRLADAELARPELPEDLREIYAALKRIAAGESVSTAVLDAALDLIRVDLAEPPVSPTAPIPNRTVGLLSLAERDELREAAREIPADDRAALGGQLGLELASEGSLDLLTPAERAAARLHLDEQRRVDLLDEIDTDLAASRRRLDDIARGE